MARTSEASLGAKEKEGEAGGAEPPMVLGLEEAIGWELLQSTPWINRARVFPSEIFAGSESRIVR